MSGAPLTIVIPTSGKTAFVESLLDDVAVQTLEPASVHVVVNNRRNAVPDRDWRRARTG